MSIGASFLGALGGGQVGSAVVKMYLDTAQYQEQLAATEAKTVAATAAMEGATSGFAKYASLAYAAAAVAAAAFAVSAVKSAIEHEQVLAALTAQVGENTAAFEAQATALQNLTGFQDEEILAADTILARFKLTNAEVRASIPTLLDYARASGKSVPDAAAVLGKALLGSAKALKAIGISSEDAAAAAGDFDKILALVNEKVGGQSAAFAETYAGKLEILSARFDDLKESVGGAIVEELTRLADTLITLSAIFDKLKESVPGAAGPLSDLLSVINPLTGPLHFLEDSVAKLGEQLGVSGDAAEANAYEMLKLSDAANALSDAVEHATSIEIGAAHAVQQHTDAMKAQRLEMLALASKELSLLLTVQDAADAQRALAKARKDGSISTRDYRDAVQAAEIATLAERTAIREQARALDEQGTGLGRIRGILREVATQAGITGKEYKRFINDALDETNAKMDRLNGKTVTVHFNTSSLNTFDDNVDRLTDKLARIGT